MNVNSQEVFQQTTIELNEVLNEKQSYLCQATSSIELLPGFDYKPTLDNEMLLDVDRYSVYPPSEGVYGGNVCGEKCVVGSIPGILDVSATGAATYSVDIKLPQALGAMVPKLAIAYNSQSANGLLGWSWNLLGLSSIERVGQTEYHDGKVTNIDFVNDRYVIDGQRLMEIGNNEYKVEIDNFDKIVSYESADKKTDYFVVWKTDGTIWEYGTKADSKVEPQGKNNVVLKWLVSKISDRNGNAIVYNYYEDNLTGETFIKNIEYTSNDKANVKAAYNVAFQYKDRQDANFGYIGESLISNTKILNKIEVLNNYSGKKIIEYLFEYDDPGNYNRNYYLHHRLKTIQLTIDGKKCNPTRIIWNSEDKWATDNNCGYNKYELNKKIFNKATFVGDFNGDGLSDVLLLPYKVQNTYTIDVKGEIYLNDGNGSFAETPMTTVDFNRNLEWVYVCDINGDGVDDIIPYEIHYNDLGGFDAVVYKALIMTNGKFLTKKTYINTTAVTLLPGNYTDRNSCGILVIDTYNGEKNKDVAKYIYFEKGELKSVDVQYSNAINGKNINCMAIDISGDGISEILSLEENGYSVYSMKNTDCCRLETCYRGGELSKKIYPFPNDYNGDGKIDMLYYDPAKFWNIAVSTGAGFSTPLQCMRNNLLQSVRLNDKDKYRYSLKELQKPTITIRTADFDGDGTADVGVFNNKAGNYYLTIGFSPYKDTQTTYSFRCFRRYNMPINYTHQTIQLGRFLPQENVSILSGLPSKPSSVAKAHIVSVIPNSLYYSVEQIIDGMGNSTELTYDYLIYNGKTRDGFYTCNGDDYYDVENKSVPILALKEVKTYSINGNPIVKKYNYINAFVHRKGRGFMGFETVTIRNYVNEELANKQVQKYGLEMMGSYYVPMLVSDQLFQGEKQLIKDHTFEYERYSCAQNKKVVVPLLSRDVETIYDVDKKCIVLKYIVKTNTYESDLSSKESYGKKVQLKTTRKGYDNVESLNPEKCQYYEEVGMYYNDDVINWVINRPEKITRFVRDKNNDIIGDAQLIEYERGNPMRVARETKIPNAYADMKDSLTLVVKYKYDQVGNVVEQIVSSPSLKTDKVVRSEFGANYKYRYKTKTIDELGRIVTCKYDDNFGVLNSTIDYNNHITRMKKEAFGIENVVTMPDGMTSVNVLRWAENHKYAPDNSSYYCWEKSAGNAEMMVFYHKSGVELRSVTFDINGKAIFVDKMYDDYGNIRQESYPYYENTDKMFVSNVYDLYNRIVETMYPDGMNVTYTYNGNSVHKELVTTDAMKRYEKESYNIMGWVTSVIDNGGNEIKYEYYSDGKLKYTQVGTNRTNRVVFTYDNRGNKASVLDPSFGLMSYKYDALGNVKKIINSQYCIEMDYDVLGRLMSRREKDIKTDKIRTTRWEYSRDYGYEGLLCRVSSSSGHLIEYVHDDKFRLKYTIEQILGAKYKTTYTYDEANRVSTISYPSGFCVEKKYSNTGYEKFICDAKTQEVLWRTNETNSNGYVTDYNLGDGSKTQYSYNPYNNMIENIMTTNGNKTLQNLEYKYDGMCNLTYRCDLNDYNYEEFKYDSYDRLTKIVLNGKVNGNMRYNNIGNIYGKEINGVNVLYNTVYAVDKPSVILSAKSDDEKVYGRFHQNIVYSTFDNVTAINEENKSLSILYGYDNNRIFMQSKVGDEVKKKTYIGNCEYVEEDGVMKVFTYLEGPMGVFAIHVKDDSETINYIHKDNIESWNVITDKDGNVLEKLSFDAWGNIRNSQRWEDDVEDEERLYDRGFTGHEHLWDFGLINMNGRLYDPLLSMMLSPDNNIQMPKSSQNFNRYSYCLNNPLKYNDPTGEFVESLAFGIAGGAANLVFNARNIDSFGEAALLFGVGFVKGFLTEYTMGQSWFLQVGIGTITEGMLAGVNSMVSVGDGSFNFSGDDWNSIKTASHYGLGSGIVKNVMYTYMTEPTETQYGESFFESCYNKEFAYGMTSLVAHGTGCWFSGQPFLSSMKFKDIGFDLKLMGIIAKRLLGAYVSGLDFGEKALDKRAREIKQSILNDLLSEIPETPDFEYTTELLGVFMEDGRLYVVGNIFQMIPGEVIETYPKPYLEEVITFPFSYSLFKTLFFNKQ